jgi:hypothetical protein
VIGLGQTEAAHQLSLGFNGDKEIQK